MTDEISSETRMIYKKANKILNDCISHGMEPYHVVTLIGCLLYRSIEEMGFSLDEAHDLADHVMDYIGNWVGNHGNDTLQNDQGTTE